MSKRALAVALGVIGLAAAAPAAADTMGFTDLFAPATWSFSATGTLSPGGSAGTAVMTTTSLSLTGGDAPSPNGADAPACAGATYGLIGPCEIRASHAGGPTAFHFTFAYDLSTADAGGPAGDLFGYIVNGVRTQVTDPGAGTFPQSGVIDVSGRSIAFFMNCTDCIGGAGTARITGFEAAAIPEPGALALLGIGLVGLVRTRRQRT